MNANQVSEKPTASNVRLASLDELIEKILPAHIAPVPSRHRLRSWLNSARVPRFKLNPTAVRGGGVVYYSVLGVEKLLKTRTLAP